MVTSLNAKLFFMSLRNVNERILQPFQSLKNKLSKDLESTVDFHDY